jgi:hypothetical protein
LAQGTKVSGLVTALASFIYRPNFQLHMMLCVSAAMGFCGLGAAVFFEPEYPSRLVSNSRFGFELRSRPLPPERRPGSTRRTLVFRRIIGEKARSNHNFDDYSRRQLVT